MLGPNHDRDGCAAGASGLLALTMTCLALGCTQLLFDGTSARSDDWARDGSLADAPDDTGIGDLVDGGDATADAGDVTSLDAGDGRRRDGLTAPGPYGPWTFASDDDLEGWSFRSASGGNACTMERDPQEGGALKLTVTEPDCTLSYSVAGLDLRRRRLRMRVHGQAGASAIIEANLFAQTGTVRFEESSRPIGEDWQPWNLFFTAPGVPAGYDSSSISSFGVSFKGASGVAWIDDVQLVDVPGSRPVPVYELFDLSDDLALTSSGATSRVAAVNRSGWLTMSATLVKGGWVSFGMPSRMDLSRAKTMRVRVRVQRAAEGQVFLRLGADSTVVTAPNFNVVYLRDWTDFVWDLRSIQGLDLVHEWGIRMSGTVGDVDLALDYVRFEEEPVSGSDAGSGDGAAADARVGG